MAITHEWHERMAHARAWHTHTHACGTHTCALVGPRDFANFVERSRASLQQPLPSTQM